MFSVTDTIRESLKLAWKHKIFWVFALLIASGSGNFNGGGSGNDSSSSSTNYKNEFNSDVNEKNSYIQELNNFTAELKSDNSVLVDLKNGLLQKSIPYIIIAVVSIFLLIILGVGLSLFLKSWATGALIGGVDDVLNNKKYTLFSLANWGRKSVRQLFKYNVYLATLSFLIVLLGVVIPVIMLAIDITLVKLIGGILLFVSIIGIIIFFYLVTFGAQYTTRFIVLNGENYNSAFKKGINTFKKNMGVTLKLAFANCLVGLVFLLIVGIVLVGVFGAIVVGLIPVIVAYIAHNFVATIIIISLGVVIGIPLILGFLAIMSAVSGYTTTYTTFAYHKLYRFVMGIDKGTKSNEIDVFNNPNNTNNGGQNEI